MKDQILKIAGVKSQKEFYQKFPDEESFMKIYSKQVKKLQLGESIKKAQGGFSASTLMRANNPEYLNSAYGNLETSQFGNVQQPSQWNSTIPKTEGGFMDSIGGMTGGMDIAGKLIGGVTDLITEGKKRKKAEAWANVSDVALEASQSRDVDINQQIMDMISKRRNAQIPVTTGEELYPIYGTGTNILQGKNGIHIKPENKGKFTATKKATGKTTEELTHSKNPLTRKRAIFSQNAKKWKHEDGGELSSGAPIPWDMIGDKTSGILTQFTGENAGGNIGGTIGGTAGMLIGGPLGEAIGQIGGQLIGTVLDPNARKIKKANNRIQRNIELMGFGQGVGEQYSSFMRTGGNLGKNLAMDGDLQLYDEGNIEPISQNPYLPEGGQTVMFRGPSHEEGGMDVSYGNNSVEVEGNEPAVKLDNGGTPGDNNLVVFGNLPIHKSLIPLLGDEDAKGKKFKTYVADLSQKEQRANKIIEKSTLKAGETEDNTSFGKLALSSLKANIMGSNMKLKDIAGKKEKAAQLQQAINDIAEENGLVANDLAIGKIKKAKLGKTISKGDKFSWEDAINSVNSVIPYLRPSDAEQLDPRQLSGEMYSLANNQLEPVQAQTYTPELSTPYNISLQDIRNENQADYNSAQRMARFNPAAQVILNSQKYQANQKVGAEEFRMNQAMKDKVYSENRNTLNDTKLKNLGIFDNQYIRQSQAKSNTKAITQAALNSVSSKYLQNQLENRKLQTYENMYNYRYDNNGRLINMNPLMQWNISGDDQSNILNNQYEDIYKKVDGEYQRIDTRKKPKTSGRNGSIVREIKTI